MNYSPLRAAEDFIAACPSETHILVAISGGSDSTGLLLAFHQAIEDAQLKHIKLSAVTIDHDLRTESSSEAAAVAELCYGLSIPHYIKRWASVKPKNGISSAARDARYALIADVANEINACIIVLGHNAGDQRETILMRAERAIRSDNLGLSGMGKAVLYAGVNWFYRPFLSVEREHIRDYLTMRGFGWIDDPSNDDLKYERVRKRQELTSSSSNDLGTLALDRMELSKQAAHWCNTHMRVHCGVVVECLLSDLPENPTLFRYVMGWLGAVVGGRMFSLSSSIADKLHSLCLHCDDGRMSGGRVTYHKHSGRLYLVRENRNVPVAELPADDEVIWDDRFRIKNHMSLALRVGQSDSAASDDIMVALTGLPNAVIKLALQTYPFVTHSDPVTDMNQSLVCERFILLRPFEQFLPCFEFDFARVLAKKLGRKPFREPPVAL